MGILWNNTDNADCRPPWRLSIENSREENLFSFSMILNLQQVYFQCVLYFKFITQGITYNFRLCADLTPPRVAVTVQILPKCCCMAPWRRSELKKNLLPYMICLHMLKTILHAGIFIPTVSQDCISVL